MKRQMIKVGILGLLLMVAVTGLTACGGDSEPQDRAFDLKIEEQKLNLDPAVIKVEKGDTVTLNIDTDESGTFHLHGYDIEKELSDDETTVMVFTADFDGSFEFTFHPDGEGHDEGHGELFESETLEIGDTFQYKVTSELAGETVPYHNHMSHENEGSITVGEGAEVQGTTNIDILEDGSFDPADVTVKPGVVVEWTNVSDVRARVTSGHPPTAADDHEDEEVEEEHEEDHDEDEVEIDLGTLEVHPR